MTHQLIYFGFAVLVLAAIGALCFLLFKPTWRNGDR